MFASAFSNQAEGKRVEVPTRDEQPTKIADLMSVLEASVAAARDRKTGGGAKTAAVYTMPSAARLFHKASIESAAPLRFPTRDGATARAERASLGVNRGTRRRQYLQRSRDDHHEGGGRRYRRHGPARRVLRERIDRRQRCLCPVRIRLERCSGRQLLADGARHR